MEDEPSASCLLNILLYVSGEYLVKITNVFLFVFNKLTAYIVLFESY